MDGAAAGCMVRWRSEVISGRLNEAYEKLVII